MKHSFLDRYSRLDSPVHRLDPRTKLVVFFSAVVIIVSESRGEIRSFLFYYGLIIGLILMSRIPLPFILKRCLMASPFILMAALFLPLSHILGGESGAAVLSGDASRSGSLLLRALAAVMLLTVLTSSERFHRLLKGLRSLGLPPLLGVLSALMYRYIFILSDELMRIRLARESRTPGKLRVGRIKVIGNQAALLFLRSWQRAQTVYNAMLARGFSGEFPQASDFSFGFRDGLFTGVVLGSFLGVRIFL